MYEPSKLMWSTPWHPMHNFLTFLLAAKYMRKCKGIGPMFIYVHFMLMLCMLLVWFACIKVMPWQLHLDLWSNKAADTQRWQRLRSCRCGFARLKFVDSLGQTGRSMLDLCLSTGSLFQAKSWLRPCANLNVGKQNCGMNELQSPTQIWLRIIFVSETFLVKLFLTICSASVMFRPSASLAAGTWTAEQWAMLAFRHFTELNWIGVLLCNLFQHGPGLKDLCVLILCQCLLFPSQTRMTQPALEAYSIRSSEWHSDMYELKRCTCTLGGQTIL